MGNLRLVAKTQTMDPDKYDELAAIIRQARAAARDSRVYWDLDENEDGNKSRKDFLFVAEREKIALKIRRKRGASSLELRFDIQPEVSPKRISAEDSRQRILDVLDSSDAPMKKTDIVNLAGISPSTWNLRIKELLKDGRVTRDGAKRTILYSKS